MTITFFIIGITAVISLSALYLNRNLFETGILRPYRVMREKNWYELISSGFLHASPAHLFVNMFVLLFFGTELEKSIGSLHFSFLYLTGLLVSSVPTLVKFSNDPAYATLGASGAVGSVLFAFIFLFPNEKLILLLLPIPISAWLFAILYLAYSIYESKGRRGKVNHEAHIAGAVWGILYMILFVPESLRHVFHTLGFY
ncbi:MAG: rhomboid family intramembrane serine protease [Balneolaceae bacterium]